MKNRGALILGLVLGLWTAWTTADQIVYLERPGTGPTWEPFFNPKTVNAVVGEKITFIARFSPLAQDSTTQVSPIDNLLSEYTWIMLTIVIRSIELGIRGVQFHSSMRLQRRYLSPPPPSHPLTTSVCFEKQLISFCRRILGVL